MIAAQLEATRALTAAEISGDKVEKITGVEVIIISIEFL